MYVHILNDKYDILNSKKDIIKQLDFNVYIFSVAYFDVFSDFLFKFLPF